VPTDYASLDDMTSVRNSLTTLYEHQNQLTGEMPYAGPEVNFGGSGAPVSSDTYHMWALIATADYYLYTGDRAWLDSVWPQYTKAVGYSTGHIDPRGLMFVTGTADWGRTGQGEENIEANVLLYRALTTGAQLAETEGDATLAARWTQAAGALKSAVNSILWDAPAGAYRDNPASSLHPQDGNSLAMWFGLTDSPAQDASILAYLRGDWNSYGAATPEWNGGDHPFPGSMEVMARFAAGDDAGALDLIRREWGYMLNSPAGTASTFWEGYNSDGRFGYESTGPGYTSLAHGWSTGPTAALTFDVLGVAPDSPGGSYHFIPHPGDLQFAQGRLTLPQGAITAAWDRGTGRFTEHLTAPAGTSGEAAVPTFGQQLTVTVNGTIAWDGTTAKSYGAHADGSYVYLDGLPAGSYTIVGSYANS
jgi:Bacterial alpha-L-rhamnosidase 6 hairpin glycosidase domain